MHRGNCNKIDLIGKANDDLCKEVFEQVSFNKKKIDKKCNSGEIDVTKKIEIEIVFPVGERYFSSFYTAVTAIKNTYSFCEKIQEINEDTFLDLMIRIQSDSEE